MKAHIVSVGSKQSAAPAPRACPTRRVVMLWIGPAACVVAGLWVWHAWWVSPEHRISQFLSAAHSGNCAAMLSLADMAEVRRLRLTPEVFRAMLVAAAGVPGGPLTGEARSEPLNDTQRAFNRGMWVRLLDRQGRELQNPAGGPAEASFYAYNTRQGWKIGVSDFLRTIVRVRQTTGNAGYARLCARFGVRQEFLVPTTASWRSVAP